MAEIIHLLSERVANQIAAGEVVQRPSSALKELIENSIDAGADEIQILTREGGKGLIQIIDNGKGMSPKDARLCFSRHATSKILHSDDLFRIRTMGFRGEALASIAAVAQVKLRTRHQEEELGTEIRIEGSEILDQMEISCPVGTSIEVRNLFYNVPARRNFLKSDIVELRHLISEIERISLAYPHIFFSFFHNQKELLHLSKGSLLQRILHLFGNSLSEKLVPIQEKTDILEISGYIGKPEFAKKSKGEQFFHLNGRFIRDAYLNHAVLNIYQEWIPPGHSPFYSIHLQVDPSKVDVNVHPSKTEIKFLDEKIIYTLLQTAIKRSLGKFHLTPQIDFEGETGFSEMSVQARNLPIQFPVSRVNPDYNPFQTQEDWNLPKSNSTDKTPWIPQNYIGKDKPELSHLIGNSNPGSESEKGKSEAALEGLLFKQKIEAQEPRNPISGMDLPDPDFNPGLFPEEESTELEDRFIRAGQDSQSLIQIQKEFIVASIFSGLIILDQQAAHERILFERYLRIFSGQIQVSQQTLFPQTYTFSAQDSELILSILPDIRLLGFDIREFGKNTFIVEGIPSDLQFRGESPIFEEILTNFKENLSMGSFNQRENLARSLSKKAAIKPGRFLSPEEMRLLIDQLFACDSPLYSPSQKPTYITLSLSEIKKKFKE
jgi:DNA mismatch repair protein MutL